MRLPQLSRDRALNDASLALGCWPRTISPFTKRLTHLSRDVWSDRAAGQQPLLPPSPSKRITKMKAAEARGRPSGPSWRAGRPFSGRDCWALVSSQTRLLLWALLCLSCLHPSVTSFFSLLCDLRQSPFPLWALTSSLLNAKGSLKAEGHSLISTIL